MHHRFQLEVDDLKMQKQISDQAHEADNQVCFDSKELDLPFSIDQLVSSF